MSTTTSATISFTVFGTPQTSGSKRAFPFQKGNGKLGVRVSDDNPKSRDWKNSVVDAFMHEYIGDLLEGPLSIQMHFFRVRPKGHFGTGKKSALLRPTADWFPISRPDLLKNARAVEDALIGVAYRDDGQIVTEILRKFYGEPARVEVTIHQLPDPVVNP